MRVYWVTINGIEYEVDEKTYDTYKGFSRVTFGNFGVNYWSSSLGVSKPITKEEYESNLNLFQNLKDLKDMLNNV